VDQIAQIMMSGPRTAGIPSRAEAAAHARLTDSQFDRALAKLHGVTRMVEQYAKAARISDRRAAAEVKKLMDRVLVDAVVIPASKATDGIPEPTEAQIAEQYVKYKDAKPGTGEYGFGYLQPQRVKFEWMTLDRDAFTNVVTLDAVDVYKQWQQHKDKYKGEFAADKPQVEKDLKAAKVDQIFADADRFYKTKLRQYTRNLSQDGPVRKLPADWETVRPKMADLAAEVDRNLKAGNPLLPSPTVDARATEWVKIDNVSAVPGVGSSSYKSGTKQGPISQLLANLHELNAESTMGLQARLPFENPLTDGKGNVYYINVLEYRGESAPESKDEVKTDIVRDLKLLAAFEKLKSEEATYQLLAVKDGLEAVAKLYGTPAGPGAADPTPTPLPIVRLAQVQREHAEGALDAAPIRDAVMAAAEALGQQFQASADNVTQRTLCVPVPATLSLAVIQIQGQQPVTVEKMRTASKGDFDGLAQSELFKLQTAPPFGFEAMKQRFDFKPMQEEGRSKSASGPLDMP
jgi:hypothetical protein